MLFFRKSLQGKCTMGATPTNGRALQADVVVVGGGGSGLACAITAAKSGARTLLFEKNQKLGGTTALSIGSITAAGTRFQKRNGIHDTPDEHFADMTLFCGPHAGKDNLELRRILVDNVPDTLEWLISLGMRFFGPMPEPPHRKPRMHNILPNSGSYIHHLEREARRVGVDIRLNARAEEPLLDGSRVAGMLMSIDGRKIETRAQRGVVLATGDYSAGREIKAMFDPALADIDAINSTNTGDGHRIGHQLGVPIRNGELMNGPSLRFGAPAKESLLRRLPPAQWLALPMQLALMNLPISLFRPLVLSFMTTYLAPEPAMFAAGAMLVNMNGERFADELAAPGFGIAKQPDKSAHIIFDEALARKFSAWPNFVSTAPGVAYAYVPDYQRVRKDVYRQAATIEALAQAIGVPPDNLRQSVEAHNSVIADPARTAGCAALVQPPFHALGPVLSWVVLTDGGLAVSARHEVLNAEGTPIPRLYAVGATGQGGLVLAGHGHHLGWAFTSGRRAGRIAAESLAH
jgi:succinate dehydrogenase/fumarate reductase flavoprotein subunit